jgi:hypothetical protein
MSCLNAQELISQLLDRELTGQQRENVLEHLEACRDCNATRESLEEVRATLHRMQAVPVPLRLANRLRQTAEQERIRVLSRRTPRQQVRYWIDCGRLTLENMMRPLALPFAGGLLSAFVLFGTLVPTFAVQRSYANDVPIALFTDPMLEEIGDYRSSPDETTLQLAVDERGRVSDVSVQQGKLTPEMQNALLFYSFSPATAFGFPRPGRVTVTFRRNTHGTCIVVRG